MQLPVRCIRGALVLLLFAELLFTIPWPWSSEPHTVPMHPTWAAPGEDVQYNSSALLKRTHGWMNYNRTNRQYETPPLAAFFGTDALFYSKPAEGLGTWLDLLVTAKQPWSNYWLFVALPQAWRVIPESTQQELSLLHDGLPVLLPASRAAPRFSKPEKWIMGQLGWHPSDFLPAHYTVCTAAVNEWTLKPSDTVSCSLYNIRDSDDEDELEGSFTIQPDPLPSGNWRGQFPTAAELEASIAAAAAARAEAARKCPHLGPGLVLGPAGRWLTAQAQKWWPAAVAIKVLMRMWHIMVPTGSLVRPLCPLFNRLHLLAYEEPFNTAIVHTLILVITARNWLYLITVTYKISRRLALLRPAPLPARLSGAALTFVGVFLGLWQSVAYTAMDAAFEIVLCKTIVFGLSQCSLVAVIAWKVWAGFGQCRTATNVWHLGKLAFREARLLVMAPHALLVNNQALVDRLPRRQVATVGSWPPPLEVPEEVDEMPVSDVPRGFICPITQAIMRQPALLLHDRTIAPSTYDKEAISQWLAEHSSDPKNPGVQLCMKSVRLVYNGDLGRSIEDWVAAQQQQRRREQQQYQSGLAAWRRALSGHLDSQQQGEGAAAEGMAAAAANVLMHMRGNMGAGTSAAAPPAAPAALAAAGAREQGSQGHAAGEAGEAAARSGSILSGAGALVRTSSAAIAQVASMDLPAVAVAGINRITTRALARRQQGQPGAGQQQQRQRPARRHWRQQQQQQDDQQQDGSERDADGDGDGYAAIDGDTDSDDAASSGSSSEVDSARQRSRTPPARRRTLRARRMQRAEVSPA